MNDDRLVTVMRRVNLYISEQVCEQMLKVKPQHRKQGNREHVLYVQCAVCIVRTVYSTCK